jgi:hypothetical protein
VLMGHPERVIPFCVRGFRVRSAEGRLLYETQDNHQTHLTIYFPEPIQTETLYLELLKFWGSTPAALLEVRVYA